MSRKVKCINCMSAGTFASPMNITKDNYEYAKHVLKTMKDTLYCTETGKCKWIGNEQYCKHYRKTEISPNEGAIIQLEKLISEYEQSLEKVE